MASLQRDPVGRYRQTSALVVTTILVAVGLSGIALVQGQEPEQQSFDGLVLVQTDEIDEVYVHPDADFGVYESVMLQDATVAFRRNWQRDQNRSATSRISARDMDRIKMDVARLFREVFTETLEENDGYELVQTAGENVLLVSPAIVDLDITAPDTLSAGRSRSYTSTAGAATLSIELYDSLAGDILARAVDRRSARRRGGQLSITTRVQNVAEARRMFGTWASVLRARLDEITQE